MYTREIENSPFLDFLWRLGDGWVNPVEGFTLFFFFSGQQFCQLTLINLFLNVWEEGRNVLRTETVMRRPDFPSDLKGSMLFLCTLTELHLQY